MVKFQLVLFFTTTYSALLKLTRVAHPKKVCCNRVLGTGRKINPEEA